MGEISFTSRIRPVSLNDFGRTVSKIGNKNSVPYPWTMKESKKAPAAFTEDICDCTMLGISDGQNVLMMHLSPETAANRNFNRLKEYIESQVDVKNKNLQAILVGSKSKERSPWGVRDNTNSKRVYNNLAGILDIFKIPYSELKDGKYPIHAAYSSLHDEWEISSSVWRSELFKKGKNSLEILKKMFKEVKISDADEVV